MRVSVSRAVDDAKGGVEWPGVDRRRLRQTTLFGTALPEPKASSVQPKIADHLHLPVTEVAPDTSTDAPVSPSLRPRPTGDRHLPEVERGQLRIPMLARVSLR